MPLPATGRFSTLLCLSAAILAGCFSTTLPEIPAPEALPRLVDAAKTQMPLYLSTPDTGDRLGFQYLLFALPVSSVYAPHLSEIVRTSLTTQAGFGSYGLLPATSNQGITNPRLMVKIVSASANGWDLFVIRRPSATITLAGEYHSRRGAVFVCEVTGSAAKLSPFAFERDLNEALERATNDAAHRLLACLGLPPSATSTLQSDTQ
jgi:hypothetical protein